MNSYIYKNYIQGKGLGIKEHGMTTPLMHVKTDSNQAVITTSGIAMHNYLEEDLLIKK